MLINSKVSFLVAILMSMQFSLIAQNSTVSPYTRYGYGVIADHSFSGGRSMGGIGYGLRTPNQINPMNPASYSCMDSLTFLFDVGATLQLSLLNDEENSHRNLNGNLMYLAMQFPLSHTIAMSAGLHPYSHTGYNFNIVNNDDDISHIDNFSGKGGLNEVYVGLSIDIWKKRLALGANVGYMFGIIEHNSKTSYSSEIIGALYTIKKVNLRNMKYNLGMQYTHPLSKTERIVLGLTYSPKIKFSSVSYDFVSTDQYARSILSADTVRNKGFSIPNSFGAGISYEKDHKWIIAADLSYQEWSKAQFFEENETYKNRHKIVIGSEYIPNSLSRKYLSRVKYRAGFNYSNSYLRFNGFGYKEYGVSLGAGFPMLDNRSYINASFEYVRVVPEISSLISEQYFRFTLSCSFNEFWFFKRRMD